MEEIASTINLVAKQFSGDPEKQLLGFGQETRCWETSPLAT